jgi:hypothetical protein
MKDKVEEHIIEEYKDWTHKELNTELIKMVNFFIEKYPNKYSTIMTTNPKYRALKYLIKLRK